MDRFLRRHWQYRIILAAFKTGVIWRSWTKSDKFPGSSQSSSASSAMNLTFWGSKQVSPVQHPLPWTWRFGDLNKSYGTEAPCVQNSHGRIFIPTVCSPVFEHRRSRPGPYYPYTRFPFQFKINNILNMVWAQCIVSHNTDSQSSHASYLLDPAPIHRWKRHLTRFLFVVSLAVFEVLVANRGDRYSRIPIRIWLTTVVFAIITFYGSRCLHGNYFSLGCIAILRLRDWRWHL